MPHRGSPRVTPQDPIVNWLVKVGKDRALLWKIMAIQRGDDPFTNMLCKGFLATGLGDAFASLKCEELRFRASRAPGSIFELLDKKDRNDALENFLVEELDIGAPHARDAIRGLINIERRFNLRSRRPDLETMERLYEELRHVRGLGEKLRHYIIYDLIRLFDFPIPRNLDAHEELLQKLEALGIRNPRETIKPEDWPWIDAALWDLKITR